MSDMAVSGNIPLDQAAVEPNILSQDYSLINRSQQVYAQERSAKKAPLTRKLIKTPDASTNQGN